MVDMEVVFQDAENNVSESFLLFLGRASKAKSNEILLYSPTKKSSFQTEWINSVLGQINYNRLMSTNAKTTEGNITFHYRSSYTLKTNRLYARNLAIMCYYPDDKEFEQLRNLRPSIIFIYGKLVHIPETAMDYGLEEN
jgi:hypothetical protein